MLSLFSVVSADSTDITNLRHFKMESPTIVKYLISAQEYERLKNIESQFIEIQKQQNTLLSTSNSELGKITIYCFDAVFISKNKIKLKTYIFM